MDYDGRVVFKIDGDDSGLRRAVSGAESSLSSLKSTIVKLGLGALLTKGMKDAVQATNKFETSLAKASTLFGNVAVDTDNLSKKILELSSATGQASDAIGNSLYNALSAGVAVTEDMGDAMSFLESATRLSVAGFTDVDTAVTATAKVMNAYGMSMEDAGRIGEVLMETQNLGITTVNELGSSLATVTPLAASFGVQFEQVGASLALMTKKGTDTATATTQLRGLIQELGQDGTTASKNLQKAFERAGLEYRNFAEYMKDPSNNLQTAVQLLADEADATGVSLSDMFSNVRAGVGALQLASDEMGVFNTFMEDMAGDTNLVEQAYNKMMDTRANKWKKMREQFKNITIEFTNSEAVQGVLDSLTNKAQGFLNKINDWLPDILAGLNSFYHKARLIFKYLEGEYDRSFLKTFVDKLIESVKKAIQSVADKFKSGNILGALAEGIGDVLLINVAFKLASGAVSSLLGGFEGKFGGIGIWVADGLLLYSKFTTAKSGDTSWARFAEDVGEALVASLGALLITGNPLVSGLVFGAVLKLTDFKTTDDVQKVLDSFADPDATFGSKATAVLDYTAKKFASLASVVGQITGLGGNERGKLDTALWSRDYKKQNGLSDDLSLNTLKAIYTLSAKFEKTAKEIWGKNGENFGKYLTMGLEEGLFKWNAETKAYELADELNEAWKEAEGIHSPSKVWEEYGVFLAEGLAQGLSGSEAEAYAKDAVAKLYDMLEQEVLKGDVTLQEAFEASNFLDGVAPEMVSKMNANATPKASSDTSKGRTTGGGGKNSIEGWTLNDAGKWVEAPKPTAWQKFWNAVAIGADTGVKGLFDFSEGMTVIEDEVEVLTEKGQFWADVMNDAIGLMLSSFEQLGEDLVEGKASWKSFAKAGLEALASILEALGYQLASMAISTYPNFAQMALSAAGSALAFTGAGLVRGFAGKFEYGGIVGGHGITGDKHMIYANAGELILSRAQQGAIASQLGNQASPNINISFNGNVFGDEQTISEFVYNGIKTAQAEGVIQAW